MLIIIGIFVGFILPMQTSINTKLSQSTTSPMIATFISFVVGSVPLIALTLLLDGSLLFPIETFSQYPWWVFIGGAIGLIYLMSSIILFQNLGASQAAILPILGQILTSLLIDHFGLFNAPVSQMTLSKFIGALCVLVGIIGTVPKQPKADSPKTNSKPLFLLLGVAAGALIAIQTAINGQLGIALHSSTKATLFGFILGGLLSGIILLITRPFPTKEHFKAQDNPWWMYFGGLIGAIFVLGSIFIVPSIGTGLTVISSLIGLSTGSLCVEHFGWFRTPVRKVTTRQILSVCLMLAGVLLIQFF